MKGKKSAKSDGARSAVWRNRIVGHGEVNPLEIVAHPKNYKAHPDHVGPSTQRLPPASTTCSAPPSPAAR